LGGSRAEPGPAFRDGNVGLFSNPRPTRGFDTGDRFDGALLAGGNFTTVSALDTHQPGPSVQHRPGATTLATTAPRSLLAARRQRPPEVWRTTFEVQHVNGNRVTMSGRGLPLSGGLATESAFPGPTGPFAPRGYVLNGSAASVEEIYSRSRCPHIYTDTTCQYGHDQTPPARPASAWRDGPAPLSTSGGGRRGAGKWRHISGPTPPLLSVATSP